MERRNLPWDLIEEILSRVPAKSLARLRSTSKQWNTLLKSGGFVKMHSANAPKESLIIMLMDFKVYLAKANLHGIHNKVASKFNLNDPHFISPQVYIRDVFHCHGLLLCTTCNNRLVVCNPCSGETKWITLRNGYKTFDLYALGYDNKSLNYKVLRVDCQGGHFPGMGNNYEIEIYDFTTDSWRGLGRSTDWVLLRGCGPHGVSVKGNTYWVASDSRPPYHDEFLLNFDFSKERFKKFSLPLDFISCSSKDLSVVREEQNFLSGSLSTDLHVWVTTISDGSVMSWRKYLNVKDIGYDFYCGMSLLATEQNENIVCCKKFIKVYRHGATATSTSKFKSYCSMLLDYVPSLAQIQQDTRDL